MVSPPKLRRRIGAEQHRFVPDTLTLPRPLPTLWHSHLFWPTGGAVQKMAPPHGRAGGRPAKPLAPPKSTSRAALTVIVRQSPIIPTEVLDSYWRFAAERQGIFFRRLSGASQPWTDDPVLGTYKFTNAYRASDRVSQYLIRNVIYRPDLPSTTTEICFRILLFKMFNKIETWELLETTFGRITHEEYTFESYDRVLTAAMQSGRRI